MAFSGVTNAHGPSPQPTSCRSITCSLMTTAVSNQAYGKVYSYFDLKVWGDGGAIRFQNIFVSCFTKDIFKHKLSRSHLDLQDLRQKFVSKITTVETF